MSTPPRPVQHPQLDGPLRITQISATVPRIYNPLVDVATVTLILSRRLTDWEQRAAADDPALDFDPTQYRVGASVGDFGDQQLVVTVGALSELDLDDYLAALERLEAEGKSMEENAVESFREFQRDLEKLQTQLKATEQLRQS